MLRKVRWMMCLVIVLKFLCSLFLFICFDLVMKWCVVGCCGCRKILVIGLVLISVLVLSMVMWL